jgi:2-haloacid dehalogenase
MPERSVVVFDLGGVLIDWDPRYLYRKLFGGDDAAMEHFLATVCTVEWNRGQDAGRKFAEAAALLKSVHPDKTDLIDAFGTRFDEMMLGEVDGSVEILTELHNQGVPLYGLTNFSAETYPLAVARFAFLRRFRGIVVSGEERVIKPDPQIYQILVERFGVNPRDAVFIDDASANVEAARRLGFHGIRFAGAAALRAELASLGLVEG